MSRKPDPIRRARLLGRPPGTGRTTLPYGAGEPVIGTVYAFDDARQAYEHLARGAFGKIVIRVAG
ncbi:hypothetical protein ABZ746_06420 [Streptomyces sp. NPDC020096]